MTMTKHFKQRLWMSSLSIIFLIICIYFSNNVLFKPFFILLNAALMSFALKEYYHLAELKGFSPLTKLGIASGAVYLFALAISLHRPYLNGLPSLILLISLLLFFIAYAKQQETSIANIAVTTFGLIYLTIPLSCILRINYFYPMGGLEDGRLWLAFILIVSKITDIGAYFCGKMYGKTKLAPKISPKKTVEGALGGTGAALTASIILAMSLQAWDAAYKITLWQSIWIGFLISILAQLGDLGESLLKRDAGVKDSSHLPGLGGILDMVDSLVFTLPFMYLLMQMEIIG
jgi:phosphatidate cytidylyltransferase